MSVYTDIHSALNTKLDALVSHPPIAWPNANYTPTVGTTYLRPTLLPAASDLHSLARGQIHKGIYQVDVFVPADRGLSTLTTWLDAIESHFAASNTLSSGSTTVYIQQSGMSTFQRDNAWYFGYISITYLVYT